MRPEDRPRVTIILEDDRPEDHPQKKIERVSVQATDDREGRIMLEAFSEFGLKIIEALSGRARVEEDPP